MKDKDIKDRILDVAIDLAEEGGFDNVRQRDVAARAGIALGTLYKRFRSKEDILSAALERDASFLERRMERSPVKGDEPTERLGAFFGVITRRLTRKPHFARAVIRAMASGVPEVANNIVAYQGRMTGMVIAAMRGVGRLSYTDATTSPPSEREITLSFMLLQIWFASLVGWSAGLFGQTKIVDQINNAAELLFAAFDEA